MCGKTEISELEKRSCPSHLTFPLDTNVMLCSQIGKTSKISSYKSALVTGFYHLGLYTTYTELQKHSSVEKVTNMGIVF